MTPSILRGIWILHKGVQFFGGSTKASSPFGGEMPFFGCLQGRGILSAAFGPLNLVAPYIYQTGEGYHAISKK
jgi:hypothetical protein